MVWLGLGLSCLWALSSILAAHASSGFHRVNNLPGSGNVVASVSYSGYYNIVTRGSQTAPMFGWFFPSQTDPMLTPIVVHASGCASQLAVLWETGPWYLNQNFMLEENANTWTKNASVLYIDSLFGLGFSETPNAQNEDYIHSDQEISEFMYKFLQQFFQQFSSYRQQDVYLHGEGLAGHWMPQLADYILQQQSSKNFNSGGGSYTIRLSGLIIGSGWLDPQIQYNTVPYATASGLLTEGSTTASKLEEQASQCYEALALEQWHDVPSLCETIIPLIKANAPWIDGMPINEYNIKLPCYPADTYNEYEGTGVQVAAPDLECYTNFILTEYFNEAQTQAALSVTTLTQWSACPSKPHNPMTLAYMKSAASALGVLLNRGLPVTFYYGKNDLQSDWKAAHKMLNSVYWQGQNNFQKAQFQYFHSGRSAQYKSYGGLTLVTIEDAGHYVAHDQPYATSSILTSTIRGWEATSIGSTNVNAQSFAPASRGNGEKEGTPAQHRIQMNGRQIQSAKAVRLD